MTNQTPQKKIEALREHTDAIRMTADEKIAMKQRLFDVVDASVAQPVLSPFTTLTLLMKRTVIVAAAFLLVATPVAYASENSLPGDFLYPVKVNVTEEIALVLTPADERDEFHQKLVVKRSEEFEELLEEKKLTAEAAMDLELALAENVEEALEASSESTENDGDIIEDHHAVFVALAVTADEVAAARRSDAANETLVEVEQRVMDLQLHVRSALDAQVSRALAKTEDDTRVLLASLVEKTERIVATYEAEHGAEEAMSDEDVTSISTAIVADDTSIMMAAAVRADEVLDAAEDAFFRAEIMAIGQEVHAAGYVDATGTVMRILGVQERIARAQEQAERDEEEKEDATTVTATSTATTTSEVILESEEDNQADDQDSIPLPEVKTEINSNSNVQISNPLPTILQ